MNKVAADSGGISSSYVQNKRNKNLDWFKVFNFLIFVASTMGCIYHIRLVTEVYLEKQVITDIRIQFSRVARVPDLSICLYFYNFVSYKNLREKQPRIFQRLKAKFPTVVNDSAFHEWKFSTEAIRFLTLEFSRLTVSQMMSTMIKTRDLIEKIDPTIRQIDLVEKVSIKGINDCRVKTNVKEPYICMTVNCPVLSANLLQQKDLELTQLLGTVLAIYFKHSLFATTEEYYVFLHPADTLPYGSQLSSVTIVTEENSHKFYIEYKLFETNLLPPPYTTNCKNYSELGYKSQKHAIEDCRNKFSLKIFGCGFYSDVIDSKSRAKLSTTDYYLKYGDPVKRKIINEIYDNCSSLHEAPDCKQEYFVPRIQKVARIDSDSTILYLSMPTEPDIINTCHPKLPLFEYLIFIGSILGTWFGFNVVSSSPSILQWFVTFFQMLTSSRSNANYVMASNKTRHTRVTPPSQDHPGRAKWRTVRSAKAVRQPLPKVVPWDQYLR